MVCGGWWTVEGVSSRLGCDDGVVRAGSDVVRTAQLKQILGDKDIGNDR